MFLKFSADVAAPEVVEVEFKRNETIMSNQMTSLKIGFLCLHEINDIPSVTTFPGISRTVGIFAFAKIF